MTTSSSDHGNALVLTARDRRLLTLLCRFRLLSRDQVMTLAPFNSLTRANTRLAALVRAHLLSRKRVPVIPGNGSAQALYSLGMASAGLVQKEPNAIRRQIQQIRRAEWSRTEHLLLCNEVLVAFGKACRRQQGRSLLAFRTEPELREALSDQAFCPDGWFAWRQENEEFNAFIEVDLHHEGLTQWRQKVLAYLSHASSGVHEQLFGFATFQVLVVAESARRLESIRKIAEPADFFRFATRDAVSAELLEAMAGRNPGGS